MIFEHLVVGPFQCNCFILGCAETRQALVVDPGDALETIAGRLAAHGLTVTTIVATHAHLDHVGAMSGLGEATGAPTCLHPEDRFLYEHLGMQASLFGLLTPPSGPVTRWLKDGDTLTWGRRRAEVIHTPGHTPGSVCFWVEDRALLFTGDTLFKGSVGRTDLWGGDHPTLMRSIRERLLTLPADARVLPGHGPGTSLGREADGNPFIASWS